MDLGIKGKRALVFGGAKGIGLGIAEALAREGVDVALASRNLAALETTAADLKKKFNVRTAAIKADLMEQSAVDTAYAKTVEALGGIDILVNNTGGPPALDSLSVTPDLWVKQFDAMVLSVIRLTNLALPGMRERKWGRVMTVASSGVIQPIPSLAISNTLRPALVGWSKTLSQEVGRDGITVNMLLPGGIRTQRVVDIWEAWAKKSGKTAAQHEAEQTAKTAVGRIGTIEEFGAVAAFIAGVQAAYITGSMIRIDGGMIASI
jgi:3-oxoacyl-[acyl-carrier protein] reductase